MAKDPQAVLQLYQTGIQQAGPKYQAGVRAAGADWEQAAKSDAAEQAYAAGVARAASQKTRQKALASVSGSAWVQAAAEVGATNYTRAAPVAAQKFAVALPDVLAAGDEAKAAARAIPGVTLADRLQRPVAAAVAVHRHWARKKGITPEV
jgi:hypothetical protein